MKKRILVLSALLVLALTMSAQALEARAASRPVLTFNRTTAYCMADCSGNGSSDEVEATLTLYQGTTYVDSWSGSGTGSVSVSGSCRVTGGKSYKLVLEYSVNGKSQASTSATGVCP